MASGQPAAMVNGKVVTMPDFRVASLVLARSGIASPSAGIPRLTAGGSGTSGPWCGVAQQDRADWADVRGTFDSVCIRRITESASTWTRPSNSRPE